PSLPALREATASRSEVSFEYRGSLRRLQPYSLLLRERFWYVIGHDVDKQEVRTYRVDRLEGDLVVGAPAAFERPDGFDPRTTFPSDPKLIGEEPAARAQVLVDEPRAGAIERELGEGAVVQRRDDGAIVAEVPCANLDAFRSWLFGLGEHAEVLGPPEVRAAVVEWLQALAVAR
ncbi:MAG: WYL domain-containing protein, partial [Actinomycetota bacterium]|nr:WYL domain-containing protein [Actinomycetota bacterium]